MPTKNCFNCGFRSLHADTCQLLGLKYGPGACKQWTAELTRCAICNQIIPVRNYILTKSKDGSWKPTCENCLSTLNTCRGCSKSTVCDYETNPSPLPKAVQKRIQQGQQVMVITVKNDERIKETCAKNCSCFDPDSNSCNREVNCCNFWRKSL